MPLLGGDHHLATWIAHLRIAEELLIQLPTFDAESFVSGSIAPDCGLPNEDWSIFTPSKEITHYFRAMGVLHDLTFYREYLAGQDTRFDQKRMSYLWGYFLHLVSDALWYRRLASTTREQYPALFTEKGDQAWWVVKEDWYDLDHRFLRNHPSSLFWKVFTNLPDPPQYVPFLPVEGIHIQFAHIRDYYGKAHIEKGIDRPFPYLNEKTMARFVAETVKSLLKLYEILRDPSTDVILNMSLELMHPEEYAAFPAPLGDKAEW
jgi:hypothetical protein